MSNQWPEMVCIKCSDGSEYNVHSLFKIENDLQGSQSILDCPILKVRKKKITNGRKRMRIPLIEAFKYELMHVNSSHDALHLPVRDYAVVIRSWLLLALFTIIF